MNGYNIDGKGTFQIHTIMRNKKCSKIWVGFVFTNSVSLLECHFDDNICKLMWKK